MAGGNRMRTLFAAIAAALLSASAGYCGAPFLKYMDKPAGSENIGVPTAADSAAERSGGKVLWYKPAWGYGFILQNDTLKHVLVDSAALTAGGIESLYPDDEVEFGIKFVSGYSNAVNVVVISEAALAKANNLARSQFLARDIRLEPGGAGPGGTSCGIKIRYTYMGRESWAQTKTYEVPAVYSQSPETVKAKALEELAKDTKLTASKAPNGFCGRSGPVYLAEVAIKGGGGDTPELAEQWSVVKTYAGNQEDLAAEKLIPLDECPEYQR
jgi:cold shock CspA family protein